MLNRMRAALRGTANRLADHPFGPRWLIAFSTAINRGCPAQSLRIARQDLLAPPDMDAARTITAEVPEAAAKAADKATDDAARVTPIVAEEAGRVTPMMEQYIEIKAANPDCLLF